MNLPLKISTYFYVSWILSLKCINNYYSTNIWVKLKNVNMHSVFNYKVFCFENISLLVQVMPRSRVDDLPDWCEITFLLGRDCCIYSVTWTFFLVPLAAKAAACLIYNNTNLYEQHLNQVQLNWNMKDFFS